ncbi:MAG TPA: peptidase [Mycobacteriales bacterium]|nr:peptidase [Mycobacteriales bacterium]
MGRRRSAVAAATTLVLATSGLAAASAPRPAGPSAGLGVRLLDAPAALAKDPRAHEYIIDNVAPGGSITRHIQVSNGTAQALPITTYADAATIASGGFRVADGHTVNDLVSWTSTDPTAFTLAPGAAKVVTVHVVVPKDASAGERYGVVLAEARPTAGPGQIALVSRVGVRMYLSVGAGGPPASDFSIDQLQAERDDSGDPVVQASVDNTGGRALDMTGTLTLDHGPGGLSAGPFPVRLGTTLAPGQREPVTVVLDKALPAGPWHARIELQSDLLRRAAEATITFPLAIGTKAAPVAAKAVPLTRNRDVLVPIAIGLVLFVVILLGLAWWRRRARMVSSGATQ